MCKSYNVYVRFEIGFFSFFVPFILVHHFPKKCGNAAMPQSGKNTRLI